MPFFDFKCQACDKIHEAFLTRYDGPPPICPSCGVITRRIFTTRTKGRCLVGADCFNSRSDRYNHPDKPNPARGWKQSAILNEEAEDAGRMPKIDDHVDVAIKAWQDAGYEL